ncbi:MAG TPA: hypothetical protein VF828_02555 [Patescibacteria group bacterium]
MSIEKVTAEQHEWLLKQHYAGKLEPRISVNIYCDPFNTGEKEVIGKGLSGFGEVLHSVEEAFEAAKQYVGWRATFIDDVNFPAHVIVDPKRPWVVKR